MSREPASRPRLSLFNYDLLRELCDHCRAERFHFVPIGDDAEPKRCAACGVEGKVVDMSDTAIMRLVMRDDGEIVVVMGKPKKN